MRNLRAVVTHGWAGPAGMVLIVLFAVVAVVGTFRGDPLAMDFESLLPPSLAHPFGTDHLGRDLLSRTGHGAATSMYVSVGSVLAATLVAIPIGLIAAWNRNRLVDTVLLRVVEIAQVVPPFILVVVILGLTSTAEWQILGVSLTPTLRLTLGLAVGFVPYMTRVVRSVAAAELEQDYVEGLRLIGVPNREILGRDVLPNLLPAVLVQFLLAVSIAVFAEGGLSYLGMGAPAPTPTLGNLIAEAGSQFLDGSWWYALLPGLVLVVGITGVNLVADAATDIALGDDRAPSDDTSVDADPATDDPLPLPLTEALR